MPFTQKGYYEAFKDGVKINRPGHSGNHRSQEEAQETIEHHAKNHGNGIYRIKRPDLEWDLRLVQQTVVGPPPTTAAAVVEQDGPSGPSGTYGPSESPGGVFFGRTDLQLGDLWRVTTTAQGQNVTPLPGGDFLVNVSGEFGWQILRGEAVFAQGTKAVTVS